jgi:hypothetical protein
MPPKTAYASTRANNQNGSCLLCPINLDITHAGHRLRDCFQWNLFESVMSTKAFATLMVEELDLPSSFIPLIAESIQTQVQKSKEKLKTSADHIHLFREGEALRPININVNIGGVVVTDMFEWDMNESANVPEVFATQLCSDLGLSGEFAMTIAGSIREQVINYQQVRRRREPPG